METGGPGRAGEKARLDGGRRGGELRGGEAVELLVVAGPLVAQDADGELLADPHRLQGVRAPVHAGDVAAGRDVGGELVELASHRQGRAVVRLQREAVRRRNDRVLDHEAL